MLAIADERPLKHPWRPGMLAVHSATTTSIGSRTNPAARSGSRGTSAPFGTRKTGKPPACESQGWAEKARAYNELITSWEAIETASHAVERVDTQIELTF